MSNRIRRIKSKAMQNKWVITERTSTGEALRRERIRVNNGAIQNGGSNLMRTKNNSVVKTNQKNSVGGGNILNMTQSDSCCGNGSKVVSKPIIHYSYMNYLNRKARGCRGPSKDCTSNNIYKKIPDVGPNGGSSTYIENKKSCVLLKEERNEDGTKRNPQIDYQNYGKVSYQKACCDPNSKLRILANNATVDNIIKPIVLNGFERKTTFTKYIGKSYSQIRNEKKPTVTKPLPFNYASLQTARVKARRNIKGSGTCNRATPYERANANIQMCKHI